MASLFQIRYRTNPEIGDVLNVNSGQFVLNFVASRSGANEVTIGADEVETLQNSLAALQTDYPTTDIQFSIEFLQENYYLNFVDLENTDFLTSLRGTTVDFAYRYFPNHTPPADYRIESIEYLPNESDPCNTYILRVKTTEDTNYIRYGLGNNQQTEVVNSSYFDLVLSRLVNYSQIEVVSGSGESDTSNIEFPSSWGITLFVDPTYINSNVRISTFLSSNYDFGFEYKLDDSEWGSSNVFTGLAEGEYTAYVRDNLGCEKSRTFTVEANEPRPEDYFKYPLANSIRMAKREDARRNILNTLSYEEKGHNFGDYFQRFEDDDVITSQFRSSYLYNRAWLMQDGEEIQELNVVQKSNNINVQDLREGLIFPYQNNKIGMVFGTNLNVLDPVTETPIGASTLDGTLLSYWEVGTFVEVEGYGWLEIEAIGDAEDSEDISYGNFLIFDVPTVSLGVKNIRTIYNKFDYEVFEYDVDWSNYIGCYQTIIKYSNDPIEDNLNPNYLSEPILIEEGETFEDWHVIKFWNTEPNQINWETGIQGKAILPQVYAPIFVPSDENDIYTTDTAKRALEYEYYETYQFTIEALPLSIARQIQAILNNDMLEIDGIGYVKEETPEIEAKIGSNLYDVNFTLTRTNGFNSNERKGNSDIIDTTGYLQITNTEDSGYLKLE